VLTISSDTITQLERIQEEDFRRQLAESLMIDYPAQAFDRDTVNAVVTVGIEDARDAGLISARGIAMYVLAAFLMGMDIKYDQRFLNAVRYSTLNEANKIQWIEEWLYAIADALDGQ
jgi:hypothetical protein